MRFAAILFDIEGTLIDCVPQTLRCWRETLAGFGHDIPIARLQPLTGMDGNDMLRALLPPEAVEAQGEEIRKAEGDRFKRDYLPDARPFPRVPELFAALKAAGLRIGIATNSTRHEVDIYCKRLCVDGLVDVVADGNDSPRGKPSPDIVRIALTRLGMRPSDAAMIGDTPYDMLAARAADVAAFGILTGGFTAAALHEAGARGVFADVTDIMQRFG
jgi:HAD superfamily hydrolase (TIGR01509 family)